MTAPFAFNCAARYRHGKAAGELLGRGPWGAAGYFGSDVSLLRDGWFPIGDVPKLGSDGFIQLSGHSKDVIRSGGESIRSQDIENVACLHPK